jgi:hypothetical protein
LSHRYLSILPFSILFRKPKLYRSNWVVFCTLANIELLPDRPCWFCSSSYGAASAAWRPTSWHHVPKTRRPCFLLRRTRPDRT